MKMLKWLLGIFKKKNKPAPLIYTCKSCVWWRAEDENLVNKHPDAEMGFCDKHKLFTHQDITCPEYLEEKFEATENSVQTDELEINHEMSVEENDTGGEKK
jgi:hypothetical protein